MPSHQAGSFTRARSVLERARHAIDANPHLWLETIRNEANAGEERLALTRMSQVTALQRAVVCCSNPKACAGASRVPALGSALGGSHFSRATQPAQSAQH